MPASMTLGLLGTGTTSLTNAQELIKDLTTDADEITFVVPVTKTHWTPDIEAIIEWADDEGHKFQAVVDDTTEGAEELADFVDAAIDTHRSARPHIKLVTLLEKAENGKLLMLWDDEDAECEKTLARAVERNVPALDLTMGLQPIEFGDDEPEPDESPEAQVADALAGAEAVGRAEEVAPDPTPAPTSGGTDDLASMGVRQLRNLAESELGLTRRKVGQMSKDDCINALREHRGGGTTPEAEAPQAVADYPADTPAPEQQWVQDPLPGLEDAPLGLPVQGELIELPISESYQRSLALEHAVKAGDDIDATIERAEAYLRFIKG